MVLADRLPVAQFIDVDALSDHRWSALATSEQASVFTSPPWLRSLAATYPDLEVRARLALDEAGAVVAGVAYARVDDALGTRRVSLPFSDFADPIGAEGDVAALVRGLAEEDEPIRFRTLRASGPMSDVAGEATGEAAWHSIATAGGDDELWSRLRGSARRNIKTAQREGVRVDFRTDESAVHRFYDLHARVRTAKYRLLPQPRAFFAELWQQFAPEGRIRVALAVHGDQDIGGILLLDWGETTYYKFNASSADQLRLRPNDLLLWSVVRDAATRGLEAVDLGISDLDQEGLVRYKSKFATHEGRVRSYVANPGGDERPELRRLFTDLSRLLADPQLPPEVAAEGGRLLYRYFC